MRFALVRSAGIWLGLRLIYALVLAFGNQRQVVSLRVSEAAFVALVTVAAAFAQSARTGERLLWANLGVTDALLLGMLALPPAIAETLIRLVTA